MKLRLLTLVLALSLLFTSTATMQETPDSLLIPIGGGYTGILDGFYEIIFARITEIPPAIDAPAPAANILVLPLGYASNPDTIRPAERSSNLADAEVRRSQIEAACKSSAPPGISCNVTLAPILTRADATDSDILEAFTPDLTAIFILGGDQTIAMQVIARTPAEKALEDAYQNGVIISGTSAGAAVQASQMLAGYSLGHEAANSLVFGAVEVWNTPTQHGLSFGLSQAILDQHFFQRGRLGRLLNAISLPDSPHIGIGIDAATGLSITHGERLENVFGQYTVAILDAETYHSAHGARYHGQRHHLSLRNVLVHLLAPGDTTYDLNTRSHSLKSPEDMVGRAFRALAAPAGAGTLILSGGLNNLPGANPVLDRFVTLSGGEEANILVVAAGYPSQGDAWRTIDQYAAVLGAPSQGLVVSMESAPPGLPDGYSGILLTGMDQSGIQPAVLAEIKAAWLAGTPLLADNAGAAIAGTFFSAHAPTPETPEAAEGATQKSFIQGNTYIARGLGLLNLTIEPQLLDDNRWGRLFSLAYDHPELIALGLSKGSAIEVSTGGASALGENGVFVLDFRQATLGLGNNRAYLVANALLDVFAPGEQIKPIPADVGSEPEQANTPAVVQAATPSPTATSLADTPPTQPLDTPQSAPRMRTPRPTSTPIPIPPPPDPNITRTMIGFGVITVVVVITGVWLNRRKAV